MPRTTADDRIETLNITPGSGGTRIDRAKYDAVRKAILKAVPARGEGIPFKALPAAVEENLPGGEIPGGGNTSWYTTTVKLDLEARGEIHRVPGSRPQRLLRGKG